MSIQSNSPQRRLAEDAKRDRLGRLKTRGGRADRPAMLRYIVQKLAKAEVRPYVAPPKKSRENARESGERKEQKPLSARQVRRSNWYIAHALAKKANGAKHQQKLARGTPGQKGDLRKPVRVGRPTQAPNEVKEGSTRFTDVEVLGSLISEQARDIRLLKTAIRHLAQHVEEAIGSWYTTFTASQIEMGKKMYVAQLFDAEKRKEAMTAAGKATRAAEKAVWAGKLADGWDATGAVYYDPGFINQSRVDNFKSLQTPVTTGDVAPKQRLQNLSDNLSELDRIALKRATDGKDLKGASKTHLTAADLDKKSRSGATFAPPAALLKDTEIVSSYDSLSNTLRNLRESGASDHVANITSCPVFESDTPLIYTFPYWEEGQVSLYWGPRGSTGHRYPGQYYKVEDGKPRPWWGD